MSKRVLIVDDQKLFADTLKRALIFEGFSRVDIETAINEDLICAKVDSFGPDLILMDIHLEELDGFVLTQKILETHPDVIVLMLTAFGYEDYIQKAMKVGASGILLKDISMEELIKSIGWASKDNFVVTNKTGMPAGPQNASNRPKWVENLSARDTEFLRLIVQGFSNDEIAQTMNLGRQTVKNYISKLYSEMKVSNRFQAIRTILQNLPEYAQKDVSPD